MDDQEMIDKMRKIILEEFTPIIKEEPEKTEQKIKAAYLFPINKVKKATMTKKLGACCSYISIHIPKDIVKSMGLEKGKMIQFTLELLEQELDGKENIPTMFLNKDNNTISENEENPENSRNNPENQPI